MLFALCLTLAADGEFNKALSVGDAAPNFENLEGTDGKTYSLASFKEKTAVILAFTCNGCEIAKAYEDRLVAFAAKHAGADAKTALVAINPGQGKSESLAAMKERATKKKFPFAYLADPTQAVAKAYGASYTPEFVVLNRERKVAYLGAMDDKDNAADAKENFLLPALEAALAGKAAAKGETAARGCRIRYR